MKSSKKNAPRTSASKWWLFAPFVLIVLAWTFYPSKPITAPAPVVTPQVQQQAVQHNVPYTKEMAELMLKALFTDMKWDAPQNAYYPIFGRLQNKKMLEQNLAGKLIVNPDINRPLGPPSVFSALASAAYLEEPKNPGVKKPALVFLLQAVVNDALEDFQNHRPFKRVLKNNMYLYIAHELLHLDQPAEAFLVPQSREHHIQEEMRVWAICDLKIVRPLGEMKDKQELQMDFWEGDKVMKSCNDDWQNCPAWRNFISNRIGE